MQIQIPLIPLFTSTDKSDALFKSLFLSVQLSILDILYYVPTWDDILQKKLVCCCFGRLNIQKCLIRIIHLMLFFELYRLFSNNQSAGF
jgi:hypothetical protein